MVAARTTGGEREYRVQPGDTLSGIARQFDTTAPTLAVLNRIQERDVITPGQVLILPSTSSPPVVAERPPSQETTTTVQRVAERPPTQETATPAKRVATRSYEVRPGDTLWSIAQRFGTTVPTLLALNRLKPQQPIKPREVLSLPSAASQPVVAEVAPRRLVAAPKRYKVQPGDTLWEIAQRFGTTVPTLLALNGLKQRQQLKPGQVLMLPPPSSQEATADTPDRREGLLVPTGV
jgi:LysM repeat protein